MKKNVTQDIVPAKRSIRDVELPSKGKDVGKVSRNKEDPFTRPVSINSKVLAEPSEPIRIESIQKPPVPPPVSDFKYSYSEPPKSKKKYLTLFGAIFIVLLAFLASAMFKSATITVTPIVQTKNIDANLTAKKDVSATTLKFQIVTVTKDLENAIDPKDIASEQKIERKSKGTIVIYNNSGTSAQKLVATTRFQTPEGLVFRLVSGVTVPGTSIKDGKQIPGSIEAEVVADQPGITYNVGLKDFTLPGLKSDPAKYKSIYGRSKTEMSGGFSGLEKVVTKDVLTKVEADMETLLKSSLAGDVTKQIPSDYVMFPNSLSYKFDSAVTITTSSGSTVAKKKGVVSAVIFDRKSLTKEILNKVLPDANSDLITITNLDNLTFSFSTGTSTVNTASTLNFTIKGDANFVWVIDEGKLKSDLLGLSKTNANTVMSSYPSIKEAWVLTRPFWNSKIPNDPKKVTVVNTFIK